MLKVAYRLVKKIPPAAVYLIFLLLLAIAIAPPLRILMFGLSLDDLLQAHCFTAG